MYIKCSRGTFSFAWNPSVTNLTCHKGMRGDMFWENHKITNARPNALLNNILRSLSYELANNFEHYWTNEISTLILKTLLVDVLLLFLTSNLILVLRITFIPLKTLNIVTSIY
jgi:hypothetical protein